VVEGFKTILPETPQWKLNIHWTNKAAALPPPWHTPRAFPTGRNEEHRKHLLATLQVYRLAIQCRHYLALHGTMPAIAPDGTLRLENLPSAQPPYDPFVQGAANAPLRAREENGVFIVSSVGPDGIDNGLAKADGPARVVKP